MGFNLSDWEVLRYLGWDNNTISKATNHILWNIPVYRFFDKMEYAKKICIW